MTAKFKTSLLCLLLLASFSLPGRAEETPISFSGLTYPIKLGLPASDKDGSIIFETPFSEAPEADYDTVLMQGEMPDPGIRLDLVLKSESFFSAPASYRSDGFRRFPNGRFWARFRVPLSRLPLKISVVNSGSRAASSLTLYETDLVRTSEDREEGVEQSTVAYVPDPELFLPEPAPFKLIRRAGWNAAPPTAPYTQHEPQYFTLHHTQAHYPENYERAVQEMQFIQDFHQNGRGWIDIAYHFLIDPAGNIFEGRPIKVLGAHVKNYNTSNIGVSIMGSYHPPTHDIFTPAARDSFISVGRYLKETYEVPADRFYAHRDLGRTDCPGDDLYAEKDSLRRLIFTPQITGLPLSPGETPATTPAQERSLRQLIKYLGGS
ncbi:MAG: hypothetical protein AUJ51_07530 [Elusimicrobia bacterium CG1_02_56_21]|nr:MAG: hypothetical protein AUJ51_07530 [Elusimicrobia bacterium CG1_02_56_21]